ncbi:hypothetical protein [Modestobacter lapidis]
MADAGTRSPPPAGRSGRAVRWWLAAATFVVGLFVGGIAVGLLSDGTTRLPDDAPSLAPTVGSAAVRPSASPSVDAPDIAVNDACLRALNGAQDVFAAIEDLGRAASELNAARLDEVVRRLQPLQERQQDNFAGCQVVTRSTDGAAVTSEPSGSTAPAPPS